MFKCDLTRVADEACQFSRAKMRKLCNNNAGASVFLGAFRITLVQSKAATAQKRKTTSRKIVNTKSYAICIKKKTVVKLSLRTKKSQTRWPGLFLG